MRGRVRTAVLYLYRAIGVESTEYSFDASDTADANMRLVATASELRLCGDHMASTVELRAIVRLCI